MAVKKLAEKIIKHEKAEMADRKKETKADKALIKDVKKVAKKKGCK